MSEHEDWEDDEESNEIFLSEPQTQFTQSTCKFPLFVAGFGSGKSTCLAINVLRDLEFPKANIGVYAPTYDLLKLILHPYFEEFLTISGIAYKLNKSDNIFSVEGHGNIIMRSLDNPGRIVGYQVFRSHIDEMDTVEAKKAEEAWNKIIARNRQKIYLRDDNGHRIKTGTGPDGRPTFKTELNRVSVYTTPEGFGFCYKRWEKNPTPDYVIFRASTYSNAHNLPDDYIDTLRSSYPPELIDAYIEGRFVNLVGGQVYPGFDREKSSTDRIVQPRDELHVGMDFNVMKGAAVIHIEEKDPEVEGGVVIYAVDEIAKAYDTDEQIAILKERYPEHIINIYPDASGNHRTASNVTETDIAKLQAAGFNVWVNYANPRIKDRVFSLSAMICNAKQERRYFVNEDKCPNYVECLEQQIWGENGLPDKKGDKDHHPDAAGYYIHYKYPIVKPGANVTVIRGSY